MITRIRVQNFKSLYDVEIPLSPLTVFVGPNNSGKSNILDAFRFLKELGSIGAPAVDSRGGFRYLVWGGDVKKKVVFQLEADIAGESGNAEPVAYRLEISGGPTHYVITREILEEYWIGPERGGWRPGWVRDQERRGQAAGAPGERLTRTLLSSSEDQNDVVLLVREGEGEVEKKVRVRDGRQLALFQVPFVEKHPAITAFADAMTRWNVYDLVPSRMRMPTAARRDLNLGAEGENVSTVLHALQAEFPEVFQEVQDVMKARLPEIKRILTPLTERGETYVSLEEASIPMSIPAWLMSQGTLHLTAQLVAILSADSGTLIGFEEPESHIHPHGLELVVEMLKAATKRCQILVTTHSPYFLDFLKSPEGLIVVEKADGKTRCSPVHDQKGVREAVRVLGLGELWYSGHLEVAP